MPLCTVEDLQITLDDATLNYNDLRLNSLPDEVLLKILSYLTPQDLHLAAAVVSKKWFYLSRDPSLMKKIILKGDIHGKTEHLVDILTNAIMLEELKIRCRDDAIILVETIAQFSGQHLKRLQVNYCPALTESCTSLLAKNCKNLKTVNIEGSGTISDIATGNLTQLKFLQHIDLFNCKYVLPKHIVDIAKNCDLLESINIGEVTHLDDNCIDALIQHRKRTLRSLILDGEDLTDKAFCNLSLCDKLEQFDLSFAEALGSPVLKEVSKLTQLKKLRYSRGRLLTKNDFCAAFGSKNLSGLINIDFAECTNFDDESIVCLANTCRNLVQMSVDWCEDLTDEGIIYLIRNCQNIENLKLIGLFKVTDAILKDIDRLLPKLKTLNLIQCPNITDQLLHTINSLNPQLDIFDYYGNHIDCETLTDEY